MKERLSEVQVYIHVCMYVYKVILSALTMLLEGKVVYTLTVVEE